jgi:dienelactone hydrolase
MVEVLFFHHSQGRTPGFLALADALRQEGHAVHAPDLFDGRTFDSIDEGMSYIRRTGFGELIERGVATADALRSDLVYAGVSFGVMSAQRLAQTRPGARGAVLLESAAPPDEFAPSWPAAVPVQFHGMAADPIFVGEGDVEYARAIVAQAKQGELFLYPGDRHLFVDSSLPSYDAEATGLVLQRVLGFLATL